MKKKYWYLYLLLLASISVLAYAICSNDVNSFGKYNSNVWGTVADWLTYLVTLAGAIFVGITLHDQVQINKQSLEEGRRSIRPYFKTKVIAPRYKGHRGEVVIYVTNAVAIDVRSVNVSEKARKFFQDHYIDVWDLDHQGITIEMNKVPDLQMTSHLFDLLFQDEVGRNYIQSFTIGNGKILSDFPKWLDK